MEVLDGLSDFTFFHHLELNVCATVVETIDVQWMHLLPPGCLFLAILS